MPVSNVIGINDRQFVRFFAEPVECEDCGEDTLGYVFENSQQIVCSHCRNVMLELERDFRRGEIRPYAFTVLKNLIADHYRRMPEEEYAFEEVVDNSEYHLEVRRLLDGLKRLGENCQSVLSLVAVGHTQKEISEVINQPIGTVGSWLARCRRKLVEVMGL